MISRKVEKMIFFNLMNIQLILTKIHKRIIALVINMFQIALKEAEKKLGELIGIASNGEEVIITLDNGSAFKIVPFSKKTPYPKFGSAKGLIEVPDSFDDPLEDFEEYMP